MEEENIFTAYSLTDYSTLVRAALTFTAKTFKDFFSYVAWLSLQYSYSGRLALRASDAWGI